MHNKITLIGRLGKDPELKQFEDGNKVCSFSIATHENYKDKNGEWQQKTEWHRVVTWGKTAGIVASNYVKGDTMLVEGKITYRTYKDRDGQERHITEIVGQLVRRLHKSAQDQNYAYSESANTHSEEEMPF